MAKYVLIALILFYFDSLLAQENNFFLVEFQDVFVHDTVSFDVNDVVVFSNKILKSNPNSGLTPMRLLFTREEENIYFISNLVSSATFEIRSWIKYELFSNRNVSFSVQVNSKIFNFNIDLLEGAYIGFEYNYEKQKMFIHQQKRQFDYD